MYNLVEISSVSIVFVDLGPGKEARASGPYGMVILIGPISLMNRRGSERGPGTDTGRDGLDRGLLLPSPKVYEVCF